MITSMALCCYYFPRDKKRIGNCTVFSALCLVLRYHIGTVAFGSCVVALVRLLRAYIDYLEKVGVRDGRLVDSGRGHSPTSTPSPARQTAGKKKTEIQKVIGGRTGATWRMRVKGEARLTTTPPHARGAHAKHSDVVVVPSYPQLSPKLPSSNHLPASQSQLIFAALDCMMWCIER